MVNLRHLVMSGQKEPEPRILFEKFPDSLKSLSLSNIPLDPPICEIRSLKELNLYNMSFSLPLGTLLDFLAGNPFLESLKLELVITTPRPHDEKPVKPIELVHLQSLSVVRILPIPPFFLSGTWIFHAFQTFNFTRLTSISPHDL